MTELTLQIFVEQQWHDAAKLQFSEPDKGHNSKVSIIYESKYSAKFYNKNAQFSPSINFPVSFWPEHQSTWFGFLDDIMPSGSSRRFWVNQLGIKHLSYSEQDFVLLKHGASAPIGNLRIKESLTQLDETEDEMYFPISDVIELNSDFLEYAQQQGAAAGGATGAGGEAPKLLIRYSKEKEIWIDAKQSDLTNNDTHYLVKFPRNQKSKIDCDILRAEYHFYHILNELGFDSINTDKMMLHEGSRYPSVFLPRFDVYFDENGINRAGLESVYSILEQPAGKSLNHFGVIETLINKFQEMDKESEEDNQFESEAFVIEWVKRDLLNIIFANSDNHGRNTAFIKIKSNIKLSPIYDFAPMKADPESITRTTQWGKPYELGGKIQWPQICEKLSDYVEPEKLLNELKITAHKCKNILQMMDEKGVPKSIMDMPSLAYHYLEKRMQEQGL
ncbi:MAG: type II toxin-antitoxin system HipA family toxin [Saccharospirillaceae bacterium]|nr:HipA domain-containing protein [Pseudomonadales bacterium]NRB80344.1 type II toxin-antitoxin system HipA family toxin [Saccharospirillaceae bacterium]